MMSVEGGGAGAVGGGGMDRSPNNLHWKKELTQIRKAARVLRDPGTSSSWWLSPPLPPPPPATSLTGFQMKNCVVEGNMSSSSDHTLPVGTNSSSYNGNRNAADRERSRVYLYNWRNQKSESGRSRLIVDDEDVESKKDEGSSSTQEESFEVSKSDGYLSDRFTAALFKCMNSNRKKKSRRGSSNYSSPSSLNRMEKLQMKMLLSRYTKNVGDGSSSVISGREDLVSLIDQSDENGDYCNSEDLGRDSAISHLLARLKNKSWSCPSLKTMNCRAKEDDSVSYSTQALSTHSYSRYAIKNPSTVESWDGDDEVDDQFGCGIPCYWSKRSTPKSRNGSSCSPSLSDTFRGRGSSFFCGSQSQRKHHRIYLNSNKRRLGSKTAAQSLVPLLDKSGDGNEGSSVMSRESEDELSEKFTYFDLEALSRLVGRRSSSSWRSREGLDLVALNGEVHEEGFPGTIKSLSHKYRPMCFEDLIGQSRVVRSLMNAVSRKRIAPLYLFQGPCGVGKTSMARVFAAALNCLATEGSKPCGVCMECAVFVAGKSRFLEEFDGSDKKGVHRLKNLLRNISVVHPLACSQCKVFVIDQCNMLPSTAWLEFLRILAKPLPFVVFILITTDINNVPRTILTRCQKHILNKIDNGDIVTRLSKISIAENLEVESNALELIASSADGSLRDAETMLDQLSLFRKRITKSLVNELMGVVSKDKLLELLELAMSSNATETVRRSREVIDSGVDPLVLISQLVALIVDIIAGTHLSVDAKQNDSFFVGKTLTERELHKLKHALTLLSEAERHLRVSSESSTWFIATLLQLGSISSPDRTPSTSSRQQTSKAAEEEYGSMPAEATTQSAEQFADEISGSSSNIRATPNTNENQLNYGKSLTVLNDDCNIRRKTLVCMDPEILRSIWLLSIEKCHSKTLKLLLHSYGRLVSISETTGGFIAHIAFEDSDIKSRADGFIISITNSFEEVLRCNVKILITLLQESLDHMQINEIPITMGNKSTNTNSTGGNSDHDLHQDHSNISREGFDVYKSHQKNATESVSGNASIISAKESKSDTERNQPLPQDGIELTKFLNVDELILETTTLKMKDGMAPQKDEVIKKMDHCSNSFSKDDIGYESGSGAGALGCSGMFCWNNRRPQRRGKAKKGTSIRGVKRGRFSLFGECAKSRTDNRTVDNMDRR